MIVDMEDMSGSFWWFSLMSAAEMRVSAVMMICVTGDILCGEAAGADNVFSVFIEALLHTGSE